MCRCVPVRRAILCVQQNLWLLPDVGRKHPMRCVVYIQLTLCSRLWTHELVFGCEDQDLWIKQNVREVICRKTKSENEVAGRLLSFIIHILCVRVHSTVYRIKSSVWTHVTCYFYYFESMHSLTEPNIVENDASIFRWHSLIIDGH